MAFSAPGGRSVPLYVLIIFVVLFLISTTLLVIMFVNHEDLSQKSITATARFDDYVGSKNERLLEPYRSIGSGMKPRESAVGALLSDRDQLAMLLTGNNKSTVKDATDALNQAIASLPEESAKQFKEISKSNLIGAMTQAIKIVETKIQESDGLAQQLKDTQNEKNILTEGRQKLEAEFGEQTKKFMDQLKSLQELFDSYKTDFTGQIDAIKTQVSSELKAKLESLQKAESQNMDELRDLVKRNLTSLIASTKELSAPEIRAAAQITVDNLIDKTDGEILDMSGQVVYIGVGKKQGINQGVHFAVISAMNKNDLRPEVKALLEVINVGEVTSEARVVAKIEGNPILKGDRLLNLVFDPQLKLTFFVMGDFDVSGDGIIDPTGYNQVVDIIRKSGGTVSKQLSPAINFVVLGSVPKKASETLSDEESSEDQKKIEEKIRQFNDLKDQIQALSIPIISEDVFLKYSGYRVAGK